MYCGARPSPGSSARPRSIKALERLYDFGEVATEEEVHPAAVDTATEEREDAPPSMLARLLGGMSWLLLFAAISIYRACTG